jgi:hypothetical protein
MRRTVHVKGHEVDLTVTIEGDSAPGIARVIAHRVQEVATDFLTTVTVTHVVDGETVKP